MINWIVSSSCLIVILLFARRIFSGKISRRLQYALWLLVAVRLLVPVNFGSSMISVENITNQISVQKQIEQPTEVYKQEILETQSEEGVKIYDSIENIQKDEWKDAKEQTYSESQAEPVVLPEEKTEVPYTKIVYGIWLTGMAVFAGVFLASNIIFSRKLKKSRKPLENSFGKLPVYETEAVETPCLFGGLFPSIYVTKEVAADEEILRHAVVHEQSHYQMGDSVWSVVRCLCLIVHWYHPLVWLAVKYSKQDGELACDEITIKKLGEEHRQAYGKTLIRLTCEKHSNFYIAATTMTAGKKSIKERIQCIAKRANLKWYALIGICLLSLLAVGCTYMGAADQDADNETSNETGINNESEIIGMPCENPQESGWDLNNVIDVRENFNEICIAPIEGKENNTYLLCENVEGVRLYGKGDLETMLLEKDGKYSEIDFYYVSNYSVLPRLMETDMDHDGQIETVIWTWLQAGTDMHMEYLLLADEVDDSLCVYLFQWEEFEDQISEVLSCNVDEKGIQPLVNGMAAGRREPHLEEARPFENVTIGSSIRFDLDERDKKVRFRAEILFCVKDQAMPIYGRGNDLTATVLWDGKNFSLADYTSKNWWMDDQILSNLKVRYDVDSFYSVKMDYDSTKMNEDTLTVSVEILPDAASVEAECLEVNLIKSTNESSRTGWAILSVNSSTQSNVERILNNADENLREGYQEAKLTYVDNAEVGWDYYADNPWSTEAERDELAQAALKELYTLTGYNVKECTYTTDGRSRFIFGKSGEYIKKCIAFYSRDYGFMLCGDAVPYQGYMNARKFHYSDVQQLIGPLDGGVQGYEGGLSGWFLENSGVYCGEKIIAHEEINKDDTVYTHVKLMFEDGYYIVVIDKKLSSCSEVSGPYYESQESEIIYYNEVQKDKVCLAVMPDGISGAGGDYRYIIPENQEEWTKAYHEMCKQATGDAKWKNEERSMGMWVVYNDEWTCMTDQGFLVHFEKRTNIEDAKEFYAACLNEANKYGIMNPMRPEDFKNITAVKLVTEDGTYSLTEQLGVFEIQKAFSSSTEIRGGAGCPFTAMMECTFEDGTTRTIYLATDSCDTWLSSGVYYQNPGFENIEELQSYFIKHGIKE